MVGIALMGALIVYAGTGLWEIGLGAILLNFIIMGGYYVIKGNKAVQR